MKDDTCAIPTKAVAAAGKAVSKYFFSVLSAAGGGFNLCGGCLCEDAVFFLCMGVPGYCVHLGVGVWVWVLVLWTPKNAGREMIKNQERTPRSSATWLDSPRVHIEAWCGGEKG